MIPEPNHPAPRGNAIWQSLARQAENLARLAPSKFTNREDWLAGLEARRIAFRQNLGLEPWPGDRSVPASREYGEFFGEGFRARKLGYELAPNCWGSATIYYPDPTPERAVPGILYVCGHAASGSHDYQAHPILHSRRGYVCLILDTIEQNDNLGEHHGFNAHWHHLRLALGISASGLEVFNSLRALDLLASDPAVDSRRLGTTGVSGGGAMSFFLAACDERIRAVSTLCGLCSAKDALVNGHLLGHCDCMFPLGIQPMDLAEVAALIAPRAALFCFGRKDKIFHIEESCRIADDARKAWELLEAEDCWQRVVADCPHGDDPEFDLATQQWFDLHLLGEERPLLDRGPHEVDESVNCVFRGMPPQPDLLHLLPEILVPRGRVPLSTDPTEWEGIRTAAISAVRGLCPADLDGEFSAGVTWEIPGNELTEYVGHIEGMGVALRVTRRGPDPRAVFISSATGGEGWQNVAPRTSALAHYPDIAAAILEPRLNGWNYSGAGQPSFPSGMHLDLEPLQAKAMSLLGLTPVAIFLQDIRVATKQLRKCFPNLPLFLHGRGESAVAALLAALLDETIAGVVLEELPWTFADRSALIGVLRVLDIHHAVGLLAPRPTFLINPGHGNWTWPPRAYSCLDCAENFDEVADLRTALDRIFQN
jgi:dienelactone hydrolase